MSKVDELIARAHELDVAATPGPWEAKREEGDREKYPYWGVMAVDKWVFFGDNMHQNNSTNDSVATAAYRTLAPLLADMLARAMAALRLVDIDRIELCDHGTCICGVVEEIEAMAKGSEA